MDRFFILNCEGHIVGNPQGYATIRGAIRESERKGSPAFRAIWQSFDSKRAVNPEWRHICKIAGFDSLTQNVRGLIASRFE